TAGNWNTIDKTSRSTVYEATISNKGIIKTKLISEWLHELNLDLVQNIIWSLGPLAERYENQHFFFEYFGSNLKINNMCFDYNKLHKN
ncbi:hypothetical protein BpHYR1_008246, partial [Brachionus plicatilis]